MGKTETIQQYAEFQEALNSITRLALQPLPLAEMLRQLANQTKALFNCDGCYITLWNESQQLTIPTAASDPLGDHRANALPQGTRSRDFVPVSGSPWHIQQQMSRPQDAP